MANSKRKIGPLVENIAEATTACLVTMAQGNLLALGVSHWIIASQTGITAGVITSAALLIWKSGKRWAVSVVLGITTAVVDYFMHPGMLGPVFLEAVVTGMAAAVLSFLVGLIVTRFKAAATTA